MIAPVPATVASAVNFSSNMLFIIEMSLEALRESISLLMVKMFLLENRNNLDLRFVLSPMKNPDESQGGLYITVQYSHPYETVLHLVWDKSAFVASCGKSCPEKRPERAGIDGSRENAWRTSSMLKDSVKDNLLKSETRQWEIKFLV